MLRFLENNIPLLPIVYDDINMCGSEYLYLDIETNGLDWLNAEVTSIQITNDKGDVGYIDTNIKQYASNLYNLILDKQIIIVGHNLIFDLSFLSVLTDKDWFKLNIQDTMLISKARGNLHNSLKHLSSKYNTKYHPLSYKLEGEYNKTYAVADVLATRELHQTWVAKGLRPIDYLSFDSLKTFGSARLNGLYVNRNVLDKVYDEITEQVNSLEIKLNQYADITWSNNNQVSQALIDLGIPLTEKTATGKHSVSVKALERVSHYEVVALLLEYRKLDKLLNTFYDDYNTSTKEIPYLYPTIHILGTDTGRTSCSNPNAQQIPLSVRKIFTSRFDNGKIGVFDLDRSELVCAVLLSGDEIMAKALLEYDYHRYVASLAFQTPYDEVTKDQRSTAKILTFGALLYGGSAKGIARQTGTNEQIVSDAIINLKQGFKKLTHWQNKQISIGQKHLRIKDTFGKIRELKLVNEFKFGMGSVKRAAMNTGIQGLSGYICLILANYLFTQLNEKGMKSLVVLQVHDEVILDIHPDEVEQAEQLVKDAFASLDNHPVINKLPGYGLIKPTGDMHIADSWYAAKLED
jgi:DNA polymerase I-like protein with 3'-5' exonuclease and polymerase domains